MPKRKKRKAVTEPISEKELSRRDFLDGLNSVDFFDRENVAMRFARQNPTEFFETMKERLNSNNRAVREESLWLLWNSKLSRKPSFLKKLIYLTNSRLRDPIITVRRVSASHLIGVLANPAVREKISKRELNLLRNNFWDMLVNRSLVMLAVKGLEHIGDKAKIRLFLVDHLNAVREGIKKQKKPGSKHNVYLDNMNLFVSHFDALALVDPEKFFEVIESDDWLGNVDVDVRLASVYALEFVGSHNEKIWLQVVRLLEDIERVDNPKMRAAVKNAFKTLEFFWVKGD